MTRSDNFALLLRVECKAATTGLKLARSRLTYVVFSGLCGRMLLMVNAMLLVIERAKASADLMRRSCAVLADSYRAARYSVATGAKAHVRRFLKRYEFSAAWISPRLRDARLVMVLIERNECVRVPHLLDHYRGLGIEHFIIVDNGSTDGILDLLRSCSDVTVFNATGQFAKSRYGIDWVNGILSHYCNQKWVLMADADEYLVYPFMDRLKLPDLVDYLASQGAESMQCLMVDMYSDRDVTQNILHSGQDPLAVCDLFDATGYRREYYPPSNTTWIKGGVRARLFFDDLSASPALNKTPLVFWRKHHAFVKAGHEVWPTHLNGLDGRSAPVTGALLHFKFMEDFSGKVSVEAARRQHTTEYEAYTQDRTDALQFVSTPTKKYEDWRSLHTSGLVQYSDAFRRFAEGAEGTK